VINSEVRVDQNSTLFSVDYISFSFDAMSRTPWKSTHSEQGSSRLIMKDVLLGVYLPTRIAEDPSAAYRYRPCSRIIRTCSVINGVVSNSNASSPYQQDMSVHNIHLAVGTFAVIIIIVLAAKNFIQRFMLMQTTYAPIVDDDGRDESEKEDNHVDSNRKE